MLTPPTAVTVLTRRVPLFLAAGAVVWGIALLLPDRTGVLFRDVTADPWRILWITAAVTVVVCLDTRHDAVEEALPRSLALSRAKAVLGAVLGFAALLASSAFVTGHGASAAAGALIGCGLVAGLVIATAVVAGQAAGTTLAFLVVLVSWVFGLDDMTYEPEPWAVLLHAPSVPDALVALLVLGGASAWWCVAGTRSDT